MNEIYKVLSSETFLSKVGVVLVFMGMGALLMFAFPTIPTGFFTDEAKIGLTGWEFAHLDFQNYLFPFFYRHFKYIMGALHPLSVSPVVLLFGLSEFTVRMASSFYAFLAICTAFFTMKVLKFRFSLLALFMLLVAPFFYHVSRIQYGQTAPLLLVQLSILLYYLLSARKRVPFYWYASVGFIGAFGSYGYTSNLLLVPLFFVVWLLVELSVSQDRRLWLQRTMAIGVAFCVIYSGVFYAALTYPEFSERFKEKQGGSHKISLIQTVLHNYPKYFSPSYLFISGEIGQPYAFVSRHSVNGSGIVYGTHALLFVFCLVGLIMFRRNQNRGKLALVITSVIWIALSPSADIITTNPQLPPYTIMMYTLGFGLAYVLAFGLETVLLRIPMSFNKAGTYVLLLVCIGIGTLFQFEVVRFFKSYLDYPKVSSDFWGWQWGPRAIIEYFQDESANYDDLFIEGAFNDPSPYMPFYSFSTGKPCPNCQVGNIDRYDPSRKQLFAVSEPRYQEMTNKSEFEIKRVLWYPNNTVAFYLITNGTKN